MNCGICGQALELELDLDECPRCNRVEDPREGSSDEVYALLRRAQGLCLLGVFLVPFTMLTLGMPFLVQLFATRKTLQALATYRQAGLVDDGLLAKIHLVKWISIGSSAITLFILVVLYLDL